MDNRGFADIDISDKYRDIENEVCNLSKEEVQARWLSIGSPKLQDYGLAIYAGISGEGWVSIDNHASSQCKSSPLQLFCSRSDYLVSRNSTDPAKACVFDHWVYRACVLAHELGIINLTTKETIASYSQSNDNSL